MSNTIASLNRKISSAADLQAVVRTMKAMAASNINQYERAVNASDGYFRTLQLGLAACLQKNKAFESQDSAIPVIPTTQPYAKAENSRIGAVVFGSDQGLVGQFNDVMIEFVTHTLNELAGRKVIWGVGERIQSGLANCHFEEGERFALPGSIGAITPLVGRILMDIEAQREKFEITEVYLFHNQPQSKSAYAPACQRLLPLDEQWQQELCSIRWPTSNLPEIINNRQTTLLAFINEYILLSLFRACTESLASENASRLLAMQRAEKNIEELLENFNQTYHRIRQSNIDEELSDIISGFGALQGISSEKRS